MLSNTFSLCKFAPKHGIIVKLQNVSPACPGIWFLVTSEKCRRFLSPVIIPPIDGIIPFFKVYNTVARGLTVIDWEKERSID